jgi:hypothetical protein
VRALINVNRISWHIKTWDGIVKRLSVGFQNVPSTLRDPVALLLAVDSGKVKGPMDIGVRVSEVHIFAIREEFVLVSIGFFLAKFWYLHTTIFEDNFRPHQKVRLHTSSMMRV